MLYCKHCKVHISTETEYCPLCHRKLEKGENVETQITFPQTQSKETQKRNLLKIIMNIVCPILIATTVLINLLTYTGVLWSVIDTMGIIYVWFLAMWSFKKDSSLGIKILANVLAINLILISVNIFGYNLATIPNELWALTYVLPFILSGVILINNVFILFKKFAIKEFLFSQLSLCLVSITFFMLMLCLDPVSVLFPKLIVGSMALISLVTIFALAPKSVVQEFKKKFHI
ncbi:MAG: DUF6320 domain-containing protein [Clostridia bacterium]|nr:DUF6320 domain-containing protein [Clostridia bacterium]